MNETKLDATFEENPDRSPETPITMEDLESKRSSLERFAMKQGMSEADAKDIAQDVIISLSKDPQKMSHADHTSYMYTCVRNRIRDFWRASGRRNEVPLSDKLADAFSDDAGEIANEIGSKGILDPYTQTPDSILIATENAEGFYNLIRQLPDTSREIIEMFYIQEMTYNEIAEKLGITPNAVGQRILYAKKLLKNLLNEHRV